MTAADKRAARTADILLDIGAVHIFDGAQPFIFTSGRAGPVYIDCRKLIAHLAPRREIIAFAADMLRAVDCDYIAGGETAGIPYAAWLSEALGKPMLYVRKKPKGFGRGAQIEGDMPDGARVLFVEDLTTDGGSKAVFVKALRDAGASVSDLFSVFYYDIYPGSRDMFAKEGLTLQALATWQDVLAAMRRRGGYAPETLAAIESFLADPIGWSRQNGGNEPRAIPA